MTRLVSVALIAGLAIAGCQSLKPLPHAELEAMLNQAMAAAEGYDDVVVTSFGIDCNPPTCAHAFMGLDHPVPAFEAAMTSRFGGRNHLLVRSRRAALANARLFLKCRPG